MRHLILEGPDGSGKTTLARTLCHRHQLTYHHEGPPPKGVSALHHYGSLLANAKRPTLFDRFHLGELVYGPILRGQSGLNQRELQILARAVVGSGTMTVVCLPDWNVCQTNTAKRAELLSEEQRREAYNIWALFLDSRFQPHDGMIGYDYTVDTLDRFELLGARPALPDGVIGHPTARILLVGEQPNSTELDLPFFGTGNSSGWLNDRIAEADIIEGNLALTNARDMMGVPRDLNFIVSQMPHLQVVCTLGKKAFDQIEEDPLPKFITVKSLPHPQFWKRFHSSKSAQYSNQLREAYYAAL